MCDCMIICFQSSDNRISIFLAPSPIGSNGSIMQTSEQAANIILPPTSDHGITSFCCFETPFPIFPATSPTLPSRWCTKPPLCAWASDLRLLGIVRSEYPKQEVPATLGWQHRNKGSELTLELLWGRLYDLGLERGFRGRDRKRNERNWVGNEWERVRIRGTQPSTKILAVTTDRVD